MVEQHLLGKQSAPRAIGYSKYVGRVGGLAVALGVGVALAGNPGTAWADDAAPSSAHQAASHSSTKSGARSKPSRPAAAARVAGRPAATTAAAHDSAAKRGSSTEVDEADQDVALPSVVSARSGAARQPKTADTTPVAATATPADQTTVVAAATAYQGPRQSRQAGVTKPVATAGPLQDFFSGVQTCACKLILKVVGAFGGIAGGAEEGGGTPPTDPNQNPLLAAVTAWVRKEIDQILAIPVIAKAAYQFNEWLTPILQDLVLCANPTVSQPLPETLDRIPIVSGLDQPTDFRFLPKDPAEDHVHIIIAEKGGAIKLVEYDGDGQASTPTTLAVIPTASDRELDAIELDPDFAKQRLSLRLVHHPQL